MLGAHLGLILSALLPLTSGECQRGNLTESTGTIFYNESSSAEDCTWHFPDFSDNDHVLVLKIHSVDLHASDGLCTGKLHFPERPDICALPRFNCLVYVTNYGSCNILDDIRSGLSFGGEICNKTKGVISGRLPRTISVEATVEGQKSVSLSYQYMRCASGLEESTALPSRTFTTPWGERPTHPTTSMIAPCEGAQTGPPVVWIACVAVLSLLLILSVIFNIWRHRRFSQVKRTTEQHWNSNTGPNGIAVIGNVYDGEYAYASHPTAQTGSCQDTLDNGIYEDMTGSRFHQQDDTYEQPIPLAHRAHFPRP